ncbi:hypothetical protein TNCV_115341 [Trichonephila clavipes]|nr:hypothetical protein TNCV_115341 [Trichonephila clavipes]
MFYRIQVWRSSTARDSIRSEAVILTGTPLTTIRARWRWLRYHPSEMKSLPVAAAYGLGHSWIRGSHPDTPRPATALSIEHMQVSGGHRVRIPAQTRIPPPL